MTDHRSSVRVVNSVISARWVQDGSDKRNAFHAIPKSSVCSNRLTNWSASCAARLCFSALSVELFWPELKYGIAREMNNVMPTNFCMMANRASKMPNADALERLAHATNQRSPLMARPLQARVIWRSRSWKILSLLSHATPRRLNANPKRPECLRRKSA